MLNAVSTKEDKLLREVGFLNFGKLINAENRESGKAEEVIAFCKHMYK